MLRSLTFVPVVLALAGAAAAQPFSQSMAQCAGFHEALGGLVTEPDRRAKLDASAAAFAQAALAQAADEGQDDPAAWVDGHRRAMRDDWEARGLLAAVSQEFRDWAAYCAKFAKDRGIELSLD